jgi:hypothetical protein
MGYDVILPGLQGIVVGRGYEFDPSVTEERKKQSGVYIDEKE